MIHDWMKIGDEDNRVVAYFCKNCTLQVPARPNGYLPPQDDIPECTGPPAPAHEQLDPRDQELTELRTGLEMMAMGMRALENTLRNHIQQGPHHSHPEP